MRSTVIFLIINLCIVAGVWSARPYIRMVLLDTGVVQTEIAIAGTGSMYPTFPKGESEDEIVRASETVAWPKMRTYPSGFNFFGNKLFGYELGRGDIVEFSNKKTEDITIKKYGETAGFVKRIIALEGDKIELRDGFVMLNGKTTDEPYTASGRSTYGGNFLADCGNLEIPKGKVFVMGDNRKASLDSRFDIGLVDKTDINYVIPFANQEDYKTKWRDTQNDRLLAHTTTLEVREFIRLLNEKRKERKLKEYVYNPLLSLSSKRRGQAMIKHNDFSHEATKSGVNLAKAIKETGYNNVLFAELYTKGFYSAEELMDNLVAFPQTEEFLYSIQYQDIGLEAVLGDVNGCPAQVVVLHAGGYVPPDYTKTEIDSWQVLADNLTSTKNTIYQLKEDKAVDEGKAEKALELIEKRLDNAQKILSRMKNNQWLTENETAFLSEDKVLHERIQEAINDLGK